VVNLQVTSNDVPKHKFLLALTGACHCVNCVYYVYCVLACMHEINFHITAAYIPASHWL